MLFFFAGLLSAWIVARGVQKCISLRSASRAFGDCPNAGTLWLHPFRALDFIFRLIAQHLLGFYFSNFAFYGKNGSTAIGTVVLWDSTPALWLSDAQAIKTVANETSTFPKDMEGYETVNFFGQNLVSTEGANWKRHRRVANPAFNEASNAFVWIETVRVVNEWFADLDTKTSVDGSLDIDAREDFVQLTLLVLASAGFGRRASWQEDSSVASDPGHRLAFRAAVSTALEHIIVRALAPKWIHALAERVHLPYVGQILRNTRDSFEALRAHMDDLVSLSRAWVVGGKISNMDAGLLRNLVEANMTQADDAHHKKLTDGELLSNIFVFLLAGHETSAHSLSFAVALLALYSDVQQKIYEETLQVWPDGCPATASPSSYKECMPKLQYTLATFQETIRLFTPVARLCKIAHADAILTGHRFTSSATGRLVDVTPFTFPVRAGSTVVIDVSALHLNPIYWGSDAAEFKPERFVDTEAYRWPRDAFFAFSGGPRSCIGQRFALTETVCVLANLVRRYQISVPSPLADKPFEEQKKLMLRWRPGITATPTNCTVQLRRRVA
ncbi:cytochrome P450 [Mycena galericulata]|nr:cytochrome P450 [Mycena galericulata]